MTEPSDEFKAWHAKRSAALLKSADELAAEYVKDGFSDSGATRRTALLKVFETADGSGWDAWQASRESAMLDAMNAATPLGKTGAMQLAKDNGQLNRRAGARHYQGPELYSEDLW